MNSPSSSQHRRIGILSLDGFRILKQTKTPNSKRIAFKFLKQWHKLLFRAKSVCSAIGTKVQMIARFGWAWLKSQPLIVWVLILGVALLAMLPIIDRLCNVFMPLSKIH